MLYVCVHPMPAVVQEVNELTEEEQQREIMALHEQKTLLLKLIEQQKQVCESVVCPCACVCVNVCAYVHVFI